MALVTGLAAGAQTFTVENNGNMFKIKRSGDNLPAQMVIYRTVSLSALAGVHFTEASGTLAFAAGDTVKFVTVTEATSIAEIYHFQTGTSRSYRFEVLDDSGTLLTHCDRSISYGTAYQHTATYVNKSVTDLVYFNNSGSIMSGSGNKYLDVPYPSSNWTKVTDVGYSQGVYTVSTSSLFNNNVALRSYLNGLDYKVYATVYFSQMEEQDGYQYIQILADNATTYDGDDPNGAVNDPSLSIYKASFILSYTPSGSVMSDAHHQFFPHRYDYVDKAAETSAGITHYEFDYDNSHLYQQKYKSSSYNAPNTGSLSLVPTVNKLSIRFDAAGSGGDTWDFKDLNVRFALVDAKAPTIIPSNVVVSARPYVPGTTFYVSIPFSEIVKVSGTPTLSTSWGNISYVSGSGSNVLTFKGEIDAADGTRFSATSVSNNITDLAGNALASTTFFVQLNAYVTSKYTITLPESTAHGTLTCDKQDAIIGETVTLTATPESNYGLASLSVLAGDSPLELTAGDNNTFTFVMPATNVNVAVAFERPIDSINFPDEKFRNYLLTQSYGNDGWLSDNEIASVISIDVNEKEIADLTGIEHFTALTTLRCEMNNLTAIDVSHNTALKVLSLSSNQITTLDVSNNTALVSLNCLANQLTSLDVSHNTALRTLYCGENNFTSLDVSHNTALDILYCDKNQLTSLDVSHNTILTSLNCSDNHLTAINLSHNTALRELSTNNNPLLQLDLSHNTALRELECTGNQLSELDLSVCTELIFVSCYNNQINVENMENLVNSLPTVQSGVFEVIDLESDTEQNVITNIQVATAREKGWNVHDSASNDYDGSAPSEYALTLSVASSHGTVTATVDGNPVVSGANVPAGKIVTITIANDMGYGNFWSVMNGETPVATTAGGNNTISFKMPFAAVNVDVTFGVCVNSANFPDANFRNYLLEHDYSSDALLTDDEIAGITEMDLYNKHIADLTGIKYFTSLQKLLCYYNELTTLDVSGCTALVEINCGNNQLTSMDVSGCTALKKIEAFFNQFTTLDMSGNTTLEYFGCSVNPLTSVDMSGCTALTYLDCANCELTTLNVDGCSELATFYCYNNQLTALNVESCTGLKLLSCGQNMLSELDVTQNTAMTRFQCAENQLSELDVSHNTALDLFDCSMNKITSLDLSHNTALTQFGCASNRINEQNMGRLVASLPTVSYGMFVGINLQDDNEQNVITTTQVTAARNKGWIIYASTEYYIVEYEGTDPSAVPGDVNGDGAVTSVDVTCIYNYLLNGDQTFIDTCDVDGDGFITTVDITVIYNIMLGSKK